MSHLIKILNLTFWDRKELIILWIYNKYKEIWISGSWGKISWKCFAAKLQQPDTIGLSLNYKLFIAYISPKCLGIVVGVPLLNFLENISSFSGSGRALLSKMIILTLWRWKRKTALVTLSSNLIWKVKYNVLRWLIIYKKTWS